MTRRVMVLAPHPDDDTLAAGALLAWAASAGGSVRIVYATDGENNPWAQRAIERRIAIGPAERRRWGARRRLEAIESLARLGVDRDAAVFLGLRDQFLADTLLAAPEALVAPLAAEIAAWRPTLLVAPSLRDRHPDHGAVALAARAALARSPASVPLVLAYENHGPGVRASGAAAWTFTPDASARAAKAAALLAHASQLAWHRGAFLAAPGECERFADERELAAADASVPSGCALRAEPGGWSFELRPGPREAFGARRLLVAALVDGMLSVVRTPFPARAPVTLRAGGVRAVTGTLGSLRRGARLRATLAGPPPAVGAEWFVKAELGWERRLGCMDRWPWLGLSVPAFTADATGPRTPAPELAASGHAHA